MLTVLFIVCLLPLALMIGRGFVIVFFEAVFAGRAD